MGNKKILIVDDDPDFVDSVASVLEAKGYKTESAPDGEAGLIKAKEFIPDLIILDVMMAKNTEGFDISRKIVKEEALKNIPVIMVTAIRDKMNLAFGFEPDDEWLPVKEVLEKTIKPEQLLEKIEKYIL